MSPETANEFATQGLLFLRKAADNLKIDGYDINPASLSMIAALAVLTQKISHAGYNAKRPGYALPDVDTMLANVDLDQLLADFKQSPDGMTIWKHLESAMHSLDE